MAKQQWRHAGRLAVLPILGMLFAVLPGEARLSAAAAPAALPVVVELFTSQSCDSCPPADAFLGELIRTRPDVLGLTFHVDYWNSEGWIDPYSSAWASARQRQYAARFRRVEIYTPQAVIDGYRQAIGSSRHDLLSQIDQARTESAADRVEVQARKNRNDIVIDVGAGSGKATIWQVGFDGSHTTQVVSGENRGRTLTEEHIVRSLQGVGGWTGTAVHLTVPASEGEHTAVLVQRDDGHILGAGVAITPP